MVIAKETDIKIVKMPIDKLPAYFDAIKKRTGNSPADFKKLAAKKGFTSKGVLKPEVKAGDIFKWLKEDFDLGRGHAMAIYHSLKEGVVNVECNRQT